jgi:hypothetical protein
LVRQQHQLATGIAIDEGAPEGLLGSEATVMNRGAIIDAGQIETNGAIANGHPLVTQYTNAKSIELAQPGIRPGKIFVIAGHEIDPVGCLESRQRLDCLGQPLDRPVDQISRDGDEVGPERVGALDDLLDEASTDGRPHVDVGELDDSKSVLRARQPIESDAHRSHFDWFAYRPEGGRCQPRDQGPGRPRDQTSEQRSAPGIEGLRGCDAPCDRPQQPQQITGNQNSEQQKHDAEPDITKPNEPLTKSTGPARENQRDWNARREQ